MTVASKVDVPKMLGELGVSYEERGNSLWACCPLVGHEEDTPSWHIEEDLNGTVNGYWQCFGCGNSGGVWELIASIQGLSSFREVRQWLDQRDLITDHVAFLPADVELECIGGPKEPESPISKAVTFNKPLNEWPTPLQKYLSSRNISAKMVERWMIGYATSGRLEGRIVFPVRTSSGEIVRYNSRKVWGMGPKYLGPAKGEPNDRSSIFGQFWWPNIANRNALVVTEGEINALACENAYPVPVAALSGSELDHRVISRISTFNTVVCVSDPDAAGEKLWDSIAGSLGRHVELSRVQFESGDAADQPRHDLAVQLIEKLGAR